MTKRILFFPAFERVTDLADHYHRVKWYVPEGNSREVYLFHRPGLDISTEEIESVRPEHFEQAEGGASNVHIVPWSRARFSLLAARSATVAFWQTTRARDLDKLSVATGKRHIVLDTRAKGTWEYVRYATLLYDRMPAAEKHALRARSRQLLLRLSHHFRDVKRAYVFGTGPSLARATEFSFSDGLRVVCNSIVRNPELLRHIEPHFIAAADFVFHYGPSRYAAEFRRDLAVALESTGAYFLIPEPIAPLMFAHFPALAQRTIAIPVANRFDPRFKLGGANVQLLDRFQVRSLDSVLNLLMLPVASTLADEIFVLGCDGRKPVDTAFWSHHSASQYSDLMQTVNNAHPGFFDVDYVDYYDRYCGHVASVIAAGEALGKSYASLVPSYVPALSARPAHIPERAPVEVGA
ncbi:MAG: hypothetical protein ACJ78Q_10885 [Chloroflexia bacterium]